MVKNRKPPAPMSLTIDFTGDRRVMEKLILEVQAAARRAGMEGPTIDVIRKPSPARKARKRPSVRKPRART